jgi:death on curing protein
VIRFVPLSAVMVMHAELIREFGGQTGLRDRGLLESALDRARNLNHYEEADIFSLAAAYAVGLTKNHPFIDGNKRVGFITAYSFLSMNGLELIASEEEAVIVMTGVADGSIDQDMLAAWFKSHSEPTKK